MIQPTHIGVRMAAGNELFYLLLQGRLSVVGLLQLALQVGFTWRHRCLEGCTMRRKIVIGQSGTRLSVHKRSIQIVANAIQLIRTVVVRLMIGVAAIILGDGIKKPQCVLEVDAKQSALRTKFDGLTCTSFFASSLILSASQHNGFKSS